MRSPHVRESGRAGVAILAAGPGNFAMQPDVQEDTRRAGRDGVGE
jgi:hypothetical protein